MGFSQYGSIRAEVMTEPIIIDFVKIYFPLWLSKLNKENYTSATFPLLVEAEENFEMPMRLMSKADLLSGAKVSNSVVLQETTTVSALIQFVKEALNYYNLRLYSLENVKNSIEKKHDCLIKDFIQTHKNNPLKEGQTDYRIYEIFDNLHDERLRDTLIYCLIAMYTDFTAIKIFLRSQFNGNAEERPTEKTTTPGKKEKNEEKKYGQKWYALYYFLRCEAYGEKLPLNDDYEIMNDPSAEIGRKLIGGGRGLQFTKALRVIFKLRDNMPRLINCNFTPEWKEIVCELSKNDPHIIRLLEKKYRF